MKDTFKYNRYGTEIRLFVGQKVKCIYYNEYFGYNALESYQRNILHRLFDKPFKPVKFGIIERDAGIHPYWLSNDGRKEQYLFVRFTEYRFSKAIPISCIYDAIESAARDRDFLEGGKDKIGEPGYSVDSYLELSKQLEMLEMFIK